MSSCFRLGDRNQNLGPLGRTLPPSGRGGSGRRAVAVGWAVVGGWGVAVGWAVAVEGFPVVGAGGGGGAVGVQGDGPAPMVDGDEVVEGTEQDQVRQGGGAAWDRGLMWWTWQAAGRWRQPGNAQCRSRAMTARRRCGGTVLVAAPTSSGRLTAGGIRRRAARCAGTRPARPGRTARRRRNAAGCPAGAAGFSVAAVRPGQALAGAGWAGAAAAGAAGGPRPAAARNRRSAGRGRRGRGGR